MRVEVELSWELDVMVVLWLSEYSAVEESDTDTRVVLDGLMLPVWVLVEPTVRVVRRLVERVGVADCVFVMAPLLVPQDVWLVDLELLVEDVIVAEEVDVFVEDAESVLAPEDVSVGEGEVDRIGDLVGGCRRVNVSVPVCVMEGRREPLPQGEDVSVRVACAVAEPVGVVVSLAAGWRVRVPVGDGSGLLL